jgi:hypothetical protein
LRERNIEVFNARQRPELDDLWRAFHHATWRLCRMGDIETQRQMKKSRSKLLRSED